MIEMFVIPAKLYNLARQRITTSTYLYDSVLIVLI